MSDLQIEYCLFCDKILVDRADGRATCVGVFHNFVTEELPFKSQPFQLRLALQGAAPLLPTTQFVINIKQPRSNIIVGSCGAQFTSSVPPGNQPSRLNLNLKMASVVLPEIGKYEVQILVDNQPIGSRYLELNRHQAK